MFACLYLLAKYLICYQKDTASLPVIGASRRLLQFAVRDAVRTVQQASFRTEPALKRLRSVVSTTPEEPLLDQRPQRLKSVTRLPGALSTALKAAAEAADDASKDRFTESVFDRLGHGTRAAKPVKELSVEPVVEDGEYKDQEHSPEVTRPEYRQRSEYDEDFTADTAMLETGTFVPDDSSSDNDGYNNVGAVKNQGLVASHTAASANKDNKSLTLQYSVAQGAEEVVRNTRLISQYPTSSTPEKASNKILNISVNVNTWKPPQYPAPGDVNEAECRASVAKSDVSAGKINSPFPKEKETAMMENVSLSCYFNSMKHQSPN